MAPSRLDLLARSFPGDLYVWLRTQRRTGASYAKVAKMLLNQYGTEVSEETARAWCKVAFDRELAEGAENYAGAARAMDAAE